MWVEMTETRIKSRIMDSYLNSAVPTPSVRWVFESYSVTTPFSLQVSWFTVFPFHTRNMIPKQCEVINCQRVMHDKCFLEANYCVVLCRSQIQLQQVLKSVFISSKLTRPHDAPPPRCVAFPLTACREGAIILIQQHAIRRTVKRCATFAYARSYRSIDYFYYRTNEQTWLCTFSKKKFHISAMLWQISKVLTFIRPCGACVWDKPQWTESWHFACTFCIPWARHFQSANT